MAAANPVAILAGGGLGLVGMMVLADKASGAQLLVGAALGAGIGFLVGGEGPAVDQAKAKTSALRDVAFQAASNKHGKDEQYSGDPLGVLGINPV